MRQYLQQATGQNVFLRNAELSFGVTDGDEKSIDPLDPANIGNFNSDGICLVRCLKTTERSFILTDNQQPDNPITYASEHFFRLTLFNKEDVIGRNCRFLQGPLTNSRAVRHVRDGVVKGEDVTVTMVNYKKDGTPFWNQLFVFPLRDNIGRVVNFIGIQSAIVNSTEIEDADSVPSSGVSTT